MKEILIITSDRRQPEDTEAISLEKIISRRLARRRRVAKRMAKRCPLMAVEFMQDEFPGYTYDEFEADVLRKTRKGKSFRSPKLKGFDWKMIRAQIPDFFAKCIERRKTRAALRGRLQDGTEFTCVVRSVWHGDYGESRLRTSELIRLWQGPLKAFVSHKAICLYEHNDNIFG